MSAPKSTRAIVARVLATVKACGDENQKAEADYIEQVLDEAYATPQAVNFAREETELPKERQGT